MLLEQTLSFINTVLFVGLLIIILVYVGVIAKQKGWGVALKAPFKPVMLIPLIIVGIFSYIRLGINFLEPSELGVVVSVLSPGGYNNQVYRSGLHWTFPFLERMDRYSYAWQMYEMTANPYETSSRNNSTNNKITQTTINTAHVTDTPVKARTADGQEVSVDCSIIYQVEPDQIIRVSIEWQSRYVQDFLRPIARGLIRTQVSQYTAAEVNSSKSLALERDINQQLRIALEDKGFGLERFILRSITFTPEYATSIEQKQIALENALRSEHEGDRIRTLARADADAVRIRAESEANALTVISNTLQSNRTLLSYRYAALTMSDAVLLDTHIWLWWLLGQEDLGPKDRQRLQALVTAGTPPAISSISLWEAQMLVSKGRLPLSLPLNRWLPLATAPETVRVLPLDTDVVLAVNELPASFHGDPADRIIVATARAHGLPLLTRDANIRRSRSVRLW